MSSSTEETVNNTENTEQREVFQKLVSDTSKLIDEIMKPASENIVASITSSITASEPQKISFEFIGLPQEKIEYGGNYSIAANPTPTKLVVTLVYLDKNANRKIIEIVESDGAVISLSIPDFVRRKAKHYPQGNYEIVCFAYDADGNESKVAVPVKLEAWDSSAERRGK